MCARFAASVGKVGGTCFVPGTEGFVPEVRCELWMLGCGVCRAGQKNTASEAGDMSANTIARCPADLENLSVS